MIRTDAADSTEARNLRLVSQHTLDGHGDTMHVNVAGGFAYVGHMGGDRIGTSVLDVSDPAAPRLVTQLKTPPGTHSHKVQVSGDLLLVNYERNPAEKGAATWTGGLAVFDISKPWRPEQIGFLPMPGKGVHRMTFWEPPYALMSGSDAGFTDQFLVIADLTDPAAPTEVGRWWLPGMHAAAGEQPAWPAGRVWKHHHSIVRGDRAYGGWWDAGLVILDISDVSAPAQVSRLDFGADVSGTTHTALPVPGRDLLVVTDECVTEGPGMRKHIRLVDISDETAPAVVGQFPVPAGDYESRPGRSGPHNLHEMRPGSFSSSRTIHATYFNAGLRVFDVTDPAAPAEIASFVPPPSAGCASLEFNDLTVTEDGLIYVTDRAGGGLYILEPEIEFP
jgi:hypothetical protein